MYRWGKLEEIRRKYPEGTRVKLLRMDDEQAPPTGTLGTVDGVDDAGDILMSWDSGSSLKLILGIDEFEIVE